MVRQILAKLLPSFAACRDVRLSVDRAQAQFTLTSLVTTTADRTCKMPGESPICPEPPSGSPMKILVYRPLTMPMAPSSRWSSPFLRRQPKGSPAGISRSHLRLRRNPERQVGTRRFHFLYSGWHGQRLELHCQSHRGSHRREQSRHRKLHRPGDWQDGHADRLVCRQPGHQ